MSELLNKLISLYLSYSPKPLGPLDYLLVVDRYNYIGWVRRKQGNLLEAWTNHQTVHFNALNCFKKALDIQEKVLQPYHSH